jgi:hypothetical protein
MYEDDVARAHLAGELDRVADECLTGQGMKNLRDRRTHPRALSGSEDDDQQILWGCTWLASRQSGSAVFGHQRGRF